MNKKILIIFTTILFIAIGAMLLYKLLSSDTTATNQVPQQQIEILGLSETNIDSVSLQEGRATSRIHNTTHDYSFSVPNSWSVEILKNESKIYPSGPSGESACLMNVYVYTDQTSASIEKFLNSGGDREPGSTLTEIAGVGTGGYAGKLYTRHSEGEIESESIFIPHENKIYSLLSAYGHIEGGSREADYVVCHPLFENLLDTFSIN